MSIPRLTPEVVSRVRELLDQPDAVPQDLREAWQRAVQDEKEAHAAVAVLEGIRWPKSTTSA